MTIDRSAFNVQGTPVEEYLSAQRDGDPEFRAYWEQTAFARALSVEVIRAACALTT